MCQMLKVKVHKEKLKHQRSKAPSSGELFVNQHRLKGERLHLAHAIFLYAKVDSADGGGEVGQRLQAYLM